ncbi:MAG TPA: hypothetical protein PLW75_12045 [Hyphomicrobium sp.]|nr:hypothetical protein [Hyphomicrobium sp.]
MTTSRPRIAAFFALTVLVAGGVLAAPGAGAAPLPSARLAAGDAAAASADSVQEVRHRRWRHRGWYGGYYGFYAPPVYIVPRYSAYDYGYPGYYYYAPRRSYYYDDYVYFERPYRRHSRAWVHERFEHPLGRR